MNIIPFQFDAHAVRVIEDASGEPWFVAKEVAEVLGYSDAHKMCERLDEDERQNRQLRGFGPRGVITINESGLYSAILGSRKPEAKTFKRWVTHEVLPSIRRTGGYQVPSRSDPGTEALRMAPLATRAARALGLDKNAAAISANQFVRKRTGVNLLEEFGSVHLVAADQQSLYLTPTELGKRLGCSGRQVNKLLLEAGLQVKKGDDWTPTDKAAGYFRLYDTGKRHGSGVPVQQMKWAEAVVKLIGQAVPA